MTLPADTVESLTLSNAVGGPLSPAQMHDRLHDVMAAGGTWDVRVNDEIERVRIDVTLPKGAPLVEELLAAGFKRPLGPDVQ